MKPLQERVEKLSAALQNLELYGVDINMQSIKKPKPVETNSIMWIIKNILRESTEGVSGCHAGIIHRCFPELGISYIGIYSYRKVADKLSQYLFNNKCVDRGALEEFSHLNPEWWGGLFGGAMFAVGSAFNKSSKCFPEKVIVDWWAAVAGRKDELINAVEV